MHWGLEMASEPESDTSLVNSSGVKIKLVLFERFHNKNRWVFPRKKLHFKDTRTAFLLFIGLELL